MDLTTATPAEIDIRIAAIDWEITGLVNQFKRWEHVLDNKFATEQERANAKAEAKKLAEQHYTLDVEALALHAEFLRRGGWTRFYLVQNTGGHVHISTECTTCFDTTDFGWLTQFSGTSHDEMGALSGMDACAVCFPGLSPEIMAAKRDARVDTPERIAAREQREAEKAAKATKAAAKAITNPDGTALRLFDYFGDLKDVKSDIAASRIVMDSAYNIRIYGARDDDGKKWTDNVEIGLRALAYKRGTTVEVERAALDKKIEAKHKRENR